MIPVEVLKMRRDRAYEALHHLQLVTPVMRPTPEQTRELHEAHSRALEASWAYSNAVFWKQREEQHVMGQV